MVNADQADGVVDVIHHVPDGRERQPPLLLFEAGLELRPAVWGKALGVDLRLGPRPEARAGRGLYVVDGQWARLLAINIGEPVLQSEISCDHYRPGEANPLRVTS